MCVFATHTNDLLVTSPEELEELMSHPSRTRMRATFGFMRRCSVFPPLNLIWDGLNIALSGLVKFNFVLLHQAETVTAEKCGTTIHRIFTLLHEHIVLQDLKLVSC